jgi:hypothetical protein
MVDIEKLADRHERLARQHPEFGRQKSNAGVVFVGDPEFLRTFSGQTTWATLLNLTARLYKGIRRIRVTISDDVHRLPHVFLPNTPGSMREASMHFLMQLKAGAFSIEEGPPPSNDPDWTWVHVGPWDRRYPPGITVAGQGWVAFVNDDSWLALLPQENPVGPMVAACFGTAEIYKSLYPRRSAEAQRRLVLSAYDYSPNPTSSPVLPEVLHLPRMYVPGAGATGMALLLLLNSTSAIRTGAGLHVVDDDTLDDTNMNRCVLALLGDIGLAKASVVESRLDIDRLALKTHRTKWQSFVEQPEHSDTLNFETVVSCVDAYSARLAVQYARPPRILLTAGTGDFLLSVSRHVLDDDLSCGLCYQARDAGPGCATASEGAQKAFADPADPSISFVSALAGILLGAELLKEIVPALHAWQICNTLRVQLLTGSARVHARPKDPNCNCSSRYVRIGYRNTWGPSSGRES